MGKVRRLRQKYHLSLQKDASESGTVKEDLPILPVDKYIPGSGDKKTLSVPVLSSDTNIFAGVTITLPDLKQTLTPAPQFTVPLGSRTEPSVSALSNSKAGARLPKKERRQARRDALLRKIDTVQKLKQEAKQKKKREKTVVTGDLKPLVDALPSFTPRLDPKSKAIIKKKKETEMKKRKPIPSQKQRLKQDMDDMKAFKTILNNKHFKVDPLSAISNYVVRTVSEDILRS